MRTTNRQEIQEVPWGMLVYQKADGQYITDDEGNFMHVFCTNQDKKSMALAIKALMDAAKAFGQTNGKVVFWAGRRPITDDELAQQLERANQGLIPDPLDIAAIRDEAKALKQSNG